MSGSLVTLLASNPGGPSGTSVVPFFSFPTAGLPQGYDTAPIVEKNANYPHGAGIRTNTSVVNTYMSWDLPLQAGTWRFDFACQVGGDSGIVTLDINGTDHGTTFDLYAASGASSFPSLTGVVIPDTGDLITVKLEVLTKNASSSGFRQRYSAISGVRTGA